MSTSSSHFAEFEPTKSSVQLAHGVVLRAAAKSDIEALVAIEDQVRGGDAELRRRGFFGKFERLSVNPERSQIVLAELSQEIVGYAEVAWLGSDGGVAPAGYYLVGCTLLPAWRRQGIGRKLTAQRLKWIAERGDTAWYFANAQNLSSIALHQEFGFREIARAPQIQRTEFSGGVGVLFGADFAALSQASY